MLALVSHPHKNYFSESDQEHAHQQPAGSNFVFLAQRSRNWSYYQVNATLSPQLYSCNGTSPAKPLPFWLSCSLSSHFHLHWEEIKWIHNGFCFLTEQTDIHEVLCNTVMIKYSLNFVEQGMFETQQYTVPYYHSTYIKATLVNIL